jgi:putative regulator of septum formation/uncharacterized protein DUF4190
MPMRQQEPENTSMNGFAIASFVLGLCGGLLGVIFGFIALNQIKNRGGRGKAFAILGIALGLAWLIGGGILVGTSSPDRDPNTGQVTNNQTVTLDQLKVGDCIPEVQEQEYTKIPLTPCTSAHKAEVVGVENMTGSSYPGDAQVTDQANNVCPEKLKAYAPAASNDDTLELFYLTPNADTWKTGDRAIVCIVQDSKGSRTTSVKS